MILTLRFPLRSICAAAGLALASSHALALEVVYRLKPIPKTATAAGTTEMRITLTDLPAEGPIRLQMPAWSPGDYSIQNHAQYVSAFTAEDEAGSAIVVAHPDANTWLFTPGSAKSVVVTYALANSPPGNFSENVRVDEKWAFYNGPATYLYVVGFKDTPAKLEIEPPVGWPKVVSALDTVVATPPTVAFKAPDYDTLADTPLVVGDAETRTFLVDGKSHIIAFFHDHAGSDYGAYTATFKSFIEQHRKVMGPLPYSRYVFYIDVNGPGGALEHLNGTRLGLGKNQSAKAAASMASHEFFHLWNVKRLRPAVLGPFDYVKPPSTANLWFCEGVTSYYGDLALVRAKISSPRDYVAGLSQKITRLQRTPARETITLDESSRKVFQARGSSGFGGLDYYLKGELVGLCLDLKIRGLTRGSATLDHVMRYMLEKYGLPKSGFPEDAIREACIAIGGDSMGAEYDIMCRTTDELPYEECLAAVGLILREPSRGRFEIVENPMANSLAIAVREHWLSLNEDEDD